MVCDGCDGREWLSNFEGLVEPTRGVGRIKFAKKNPGRKSFFCENDPLFFVKLSTGGAPNEKFSMGGLARVRKVTGEQKFAEKRQNIVLLDRGV